MTVLSRILLLLLLLLPLFGMISMAAATVLAHEATNKLYFLGCRLSCILIVRDFETLTQFSQGRSTLFHAVLVGTTACLGTHHIFLLVT